MPSANAIWIKGKHTITFGGSWSYTQLNTRDQRTGQGIIGFADFSQFLQGLVTPYSTDGFIATTYLAGQRESLLSRQRVGRIYPGQIPASPQPERHGWTALGL